MALGQKLATGPRFNLFVSTTDKLDWQCGNMIEHIVDTSAEDIPKK